MYPLQRLNNYWFEKKSREWSYKYQISSNKRVSMTEILPFPEDHKDDDFCTQHAVVNASEARLRLEELKARRLLEAVRKPVKKVSRLSIQNAIDVCRTGNYDVLALLGDGVSNVDTERMIEGKLGIVYAKLYPFGGPRGRHGRFEKKIFNLQKWKRYKVNHFALAAKQSYVEKGEEEKFIPHLVKELRRKGPFVGNFEVRERHLEKRYKSRKRILRRVGEVATHGNGDPKVHCVVITGYKFKRTRRNKKPRGYWKFLNNSGLKWGNNGFRRMR